MYKNVENLIINTIKRENAEGSFTAVTEFYRDGFNIEQLRLQLQILANNYPEEVRESVTAKDVCDYVQNMSPFEKALISEAFVLLKILIVMPATNAVSERSFSALRRLKNYMRSTMSQDRLNHLLFLHAHKDYTNSLDLIAVANDFVSFSEQPDSNFWQV